MEREYRVLKALQGSAVPVPPVYHLCEDDRSVLLSMHIHIRTHVGQWVGDQSTNNGLCVR